MLTTLRPRFGHGDLDGPGLPADLLVTAAISRAHVPCLAALLLEELDRDITATACGSGAATTTAALLRHMMMERRVRSGGMRMRPLGV